MIFGYIKRWKQRGKAAGISSKYSSVRGGFEECSASAQAGGEKFGTDPSSGNGAGQRWAGGRNLVEVQSGAMGGIRFGTGQKLPGVVDKGMWQLSVAGSMGLSLMNAELVSIWVEDNGGFASRWHEPGLKGEWDVFVFEIGNGLFEVLDLENEVGSVAAGFQKGLISNAESVGADFVFEPELRAFLMASCLGEAEDLLVESPGTHKIRGRVSDEGEFRNFGRLHGSVGDSVKDGREKGAARLVVKTDGHEGHGLCDFQALVQTPA